MGVYKRKRDRTFIAQIRSKGRTIYLGTYITEKKAMIRFLEESIRMLQKELSELV